MMGLGVSLLAPLVNLLVVPIFSLLLVPWIFAAFVLLITVPPIGQWLLLWAAKALVFQVDILAGIIAFEMVELYRPPLTPMVYVALIVGFMLFLFPRGVPGRPLCVLFFLPLFAVSPVRPSKGDFWVTQLDVGQGLALVISTHNHLLLYDTGPRYRGGFDAGESVVTPYLRHAGYSRIDRVILSNGDMDHRGGFRSLYSAFGVTDVYSGEPNKIKVGTVHRCYAGQKWHWDGVDFEILHPSPESSWQGNSASCVLRVSNRSGVLLATGDIERAAELSLLRQTLGALRADVVTVPHHGSKSSSIRAFTEAVSASIAMVSAGYGNRYGFPKKEIVDRWQESGSAVYSSFESGALSIRFSQSTGISTPHSYRQQMKRYWMSD